MNTKREMDGGFPGMIPAADPFAERGGAAVTPFEIAGGTVTGHAHVAAGRNNQDAFCWASDADGLVAVVCDGCGSGPHSEVGAQLGARLVVQAARTLLRTGLNGPELLEQARQDVLANLRLLAQAMGGASFSRTVADYFLFTIVGVLITADSATTFSIGDGLVVINGDRTQLGPFPNNEPSYLGYALLPGAGDLSFQVHRSMAASEVQSLVLGTDGVVELDAMAERPIQGRAEAVGPLSQFWSDDRVFKNADMVRRRLAVINRGPRGLLSDDTTLVVVRRKTGEG
jgi:protein phosphatase 2C-like protein